MAETNYSGIIEAKGLVNSNTIIDYHIIPAPPASTGGSTYTLLLTNKRLFPYKTGQDLIQTKLTIYKGKKLSYLSNATVELWFNYGGTWQKYEEYTTNRYGIVNSTHSTEFIPNISCCLGYAKLIYKGNTYNSNIVRFNFTKGIPITFFINAGSCNTTITDRSSYDIFDGDSRVNLFDRMWVEP